MNLSQNFTLDELTFSETAARNGIDNTPPDDVLENLQVLAAGLEDVRALLGGKPVNVSSGYRCAALNAYIGGSFTSAHMSGFAADFTCRGFGSPLDVARKIASVNAHLFGIGNGIAFDQLIVEFGRWVHISFDPKLRGEVFTAVRLASGRTEYRPGLA